MTARCVVALLSAWMLGGLIVGALWPRTREVRRDGLLVLGLSGIVGLGTTATIFFGASLVTRQPLWLATSVELLLAAPLVWIIRRQWIHSVSRDTTMPAPGWITWLTASLLVQAGLLAGIAALRMYQHQPYGDWDGWAIWNLQARFMFRAADVWPDLLGAPQLSWTHPDYPRLLPAAVARMWTWAGGELPLAPVLVGSTFAFATLCLMTGVVWHLRGRIPALVGGLLLLGTPYFVLSSVSEQADIPLGAFMLGAVALLLLRDRGDGAWGWGVLAGACAGFAAGTKNEGLLFLLVITAAWSLHAWRRRAWAGWAEFGVGAAVVLAPVIYFKVALAPVNDLMATSVSTRLAMLFDGDRHRTILSSLAGGVRGFGLWRVMPHLAMALPFLAWSRRRRFVGAEVLILVVVGLMLAGYYGVYLTSPHNLSWHLETSLSRLLLQLWPLALLAWLLSFPCPDDTSARPIPLPARSLLLGANVVAAGAILFVTSGQTAVDELTARRVGWARVSATLGEGWFELERQPRETWAWSKGTGSLQLHSEARSGRSVTLRFALRSASPRTVTVRLGDRVLWEGRVADDFVPIALAGLELAPGTTRLDLVSLEPVVADLGNIAAPARAFAVYNLRFD